MPNFPGYRCSLCGREYPPEAIIYTCPQDGGNLDVILDLDAARAVRSPGDFISAGSSAEPSLWRYLPLLPVPDPGAQGTPLRAAGWTPIYRPARLMKQFEQIRKTMKSVAGGKMGNMMSKLKF